jgi:HK97 family phage portal protein
VSFLRRVARGAEFRSLTSGLSNPASWLTDALGGPVTYSGKRVNQSTALGLVPVFAAVTLISEAVGQIPLKVYRLGDDGDKQEARQHRTWQMLHDAPNPETPARRFWATVTAQLLLWGNAFIEKRRSDGILVDELWLLDPAQMTVMWDPVTRTKTFRQHTDQGRRDFTSDDLLHITGLSLDGIVGVSRITYCRHSLGTAIGRDEYEGTFWKRGATMRGVVEHPKKLGGEGLRNLRESMDAIYGGSSNAGRTGALEEGATFRPLSMPLRDMEFVELRRMTARDIATLFNIPASFLNESSGSSLTYSTVESNQIQFVQNGVRPWTSHIEEALAQDPAIFPQQNTFDAEFVLESLMRADAESRMRYYQGMSGIKAITVNEVRRRENLPPVDGGDVPGLPETERVSETAPTTTPPAIEPTPGQQQPPALPAPRPALAAVPSRTS